MSHSSMHVQVCLLPLGNLSVCLLLINAVADITDCAARVCRRKYAVQGTCACVPSQLLEAVHGQAQY
jgi:hypothetical protein